MVPDHQKACSNYQGSLVTMLNSYITTKTEQVEPNLSSNLEYSEFSIISRLRLAYNPFNFGIVVYV